MNQARSGPKSILSLLCGCGLALSAAAPGAGCTPSHEVKPGAPVMLSFGVFDPNGYPVTLTSEAGAVPAPPLAHFVAYFDRLLDPDSLEDADAGAKTGLASGSYGAAGTPIPLTTIYSPNGDPTSVRTQVGPSFTVSPICGLPSSTAAQVSVDLAKLRSHDLKTSAVAGEGAVPTIAFMTAPLTVAIDAPAPVADQPGTLDDPQKTIALTFNDLVPGDAPFPGCAALPSIKGHIKVSATLAGVPILPFAAVVGPNKDNPLEWDVSPPGTGTDQSGEWPAGATVTITVDAAATDLFGMALPADATASFVVKS